MYESAVHEAAAAAAKAAVQHMSKQHADHATSTHGSRGSLSAAGISAMRAGRSNDGVQQAHDGVQQAPARRHAVSASSALGSLSLGSLGSLGSLAANGYGMPIVGPAMQPKASAQVQSPRAAESSCRPDVSAVGRPKEATRIVESTWGGFSSIDKMPSPVRTKKPRSTMNALNAFRAMSDAKEKSDNS